MLVPSPLTRPRAPRRTTSESPCSLAHEARASALTRRVGRRQTPSSASGNRANSASLTEAQHCVAEKLEALVVTGLPRLVRVARVRERLAEVRRVERKPEQLGYRHLIGHAGAEATASCRQWPDSGAKRRVRVTTGPPKHPVERGRFANPDYPEPNALLGCPFCREMFPSEEEALCPVCGVDCSRSSSSLPRTRPGSPPPSSWPPPRRSTGPFPGPTPGAAAPPSSCCRSSAWSPFSDPQLSSRGRISTSSPVSSSRATAPVRFWGGAVGWFILFPLIATRRTIFQLRGVRAVAESPSRG